MIPALHKLFQRTQEKGTLPNLSYEASIIPIPKPDNDITRKENYRPIFLMRIGAKIFHNLVKSNPAIWKRKLGLFVLPLK